MKNPSIQKLFDLHGKVAIVTGSRNLGYDMAEALGGSGASVVITSRTADAANEAARRLRDESGIDACGMKLEVTDEDNWKQVVSGTAERFGHIDILINNAGGRSPSYHHEGDGDDLSVNYIDARPLDLWRHTMDTNINGIFIGCKTVSPYMKKQGGGKIVNIASIDGMVGRDLRVYIDTGLSPTIPDYAASKGAVISLTRALATALAPSSIYVNCISPGGFFRNQPDAFVKNYSACIPLGRMGRDGIDIKGAALFLSCAASDYVVGHNLVVDGGFTAW